MRHSSIGNSSWRRAPWTPLAYATYVKSKKEKGLPVNRILEGMQPICTLPLWEGVCPHTFLKWENFLSVQGSSLKEIACLSQSPPPLHSSCGWCTCIPPLFMLSLSAGQHSQHHFSFPLTSSSLPQCLENHTINQGDVQSGRALIIWLWWNLNTSFGKNFKCVQATESLM